MAGASVGRLSPPMKRSSDLWKASLGVTDSLNLQRGPGGLSVLAHCPCPVVSVLVTGRAVETKLQLLPVRTGMLFLLR